MGMIKKTHNEVDVQRGDFRWGLESCFKHSESSRGRHKKYEVWTRHISCMSGGDLCDGETKGGEIRDASQKFCFLQQSSTAAMIKCMAGGVATAARASSSASKPLRISPDACTWCKHRYKTAISVQALCSAGMEGRRGSPMAAFFFCEYEVILKLLTFS